MRVAYSLSTYTNTSAVKQKTMDCIQNIRTNTNAKIITANHLPGDTDLIELCDYYIYDSDNVLTTHTFYNLAWQQTDVFKATIDLKNTNNNIYHGPAVHQNIYNGVAVANTMGCDYVVCTNFDTMFSPNEFGKISDIILELHETDKQGFFLYEKAQEGDTLKTVFFIIKPKFYLEHFSNIRSEDDYNELVLSSGSPSNGLENIYYHVLSNNLNDLKIIEQHETEFFNESQSFNSSQAEYFAVLPIRDINSNEHNASIYCYCVNDKDDRLVKYCVKENGLNIVESGFEIKGRMWHMNHFYAKHDAIYEIEFTIIGQTATKTKYLSYAGYPEIEKCGELCLF